MPLSIDTFLQQRNNHPVIDVRSEEEFATGHIPGAVNIPLLNNEERVIVGTAYKQRGQQHAIKEGFRLVGPRLLDITTQAEKAAKGKEVLVHCWRGGMRSNNFCQFIAMAGIKSSPLQGGYKAYRTHAIESFRRPFQFVLLSGCTGSGKTEVLQQLKAKGEQVIDLEGLACHKGSAFGGLMMPHQPTTEQFQNNLFEEILKCDLTKRIWIEDESLAIGKIFLPENFWLHMRASAMVQIEVSKADRVQRLVKEYGHTNREEFLSTMGKIVKRLGGQHYKAAKEKLLAGDMAATIDILLTYYDKTYRESMEQRKDQLIKTLLWDGRDVINFTQELIKQTTWQTK